VVLDFLQAPAPPVYPKEAKIQGRGYYEPKSGGAKVYGNIDGRTTGTWVEFTASWDNGSVGVYTGRVRDEGDHMDGNASGITRDRDRPQSTADWSSVGRLYCLERFLFP
jgi:hypothetical protein